MFKTRCSVLLFVLWSMSPAVLQKLGYVLTWKSKTSISAPHPNECHPQQSVSLPTLTFSCSLFYITRSSFQDFGRKKKKKEVSHCFFNEPSTLFTRTLLHPASILSLDDLGFRLEDLRLDRESLIQGLFGLLNLRFGEARLCF